MNEEEFDRLRSDIRDELERVKAELATGIGQALSDGRDSSGALTFVNTVLLAVILWRVW